MKLLPAFALLAGCLLPACGMGLHHNSTVAKTLPYHAPLAELLDYAPLVDAPLAAPAIAPGTGVMVLRLGAYYPRPAALVMRVSGTTQWGVNEGAAKPETELTTLLEGVLARKADPGPRNIFIEGVITGFEWYTLVNARGGVVRSAGRVSSLLTVTNSSGRVLFEGERTTTGNASAPDVLYRAHARAWLADTGFVGALTQTGGGS